MFARPTSTFDRLLEKATSKLLLDPDWESTMLICDAIRQGDVQPSYFLQGIKKKIENDNPHVAKFALQVLESVVKNCGSIIHIEVATREFMEFIKDQAKRRQDPVKSKIMELVQIWSHAFRNESTYKVVQETFNTMKAEGFVFPTLKESDAMFTAEKAPEWRDGELCHRCRAAFTTFNRKHHCRACGQVFCQKCTSKNSIIPKFGIEKEVRVCDSCYDQINKPSDKKSEDDLPSEYLSSSLSKQPQVYSNIDQFDGSNENTTKAPPTRTEAEIQEEEELQLALALSQSEAEAKEKMKNKHNFSGYSSSTNESNSNLYSQPVKNQAPAAATMIDTSDMDPELARYLNRNYWQQKSVEIKASTTQPSAPSVAAESKVSNISNSGGGGSTYAPKEEEKYQNGETDDRDQFLNALRSSIEIFVNRMKSNSQRGRSIANDSSVQTLFMTLNAMHPTLMKYIQEQEDTRAHYESLQDKLAQLKDARDALDVLRQEHREKRRREQEEMERLRQIQMAQKLEVLRQQKQVYLEYQRQLALQRMQEQEMEMRRRLEMQKQEQQMRAMQYGYPQGYGQPQPQMVHTYSPVNSTEGSPMHQIHGQQVAYGGQQGMQMPPGQPPMSMPPGQPPMSMPPGQPPMPGQSGIPGMPPQGIPTGNPGSVYSQAGPGYSQGQMPPQTMPVGYHMQQQHPGYSNPTVPGGPGSYVPGAQNQPVTTAYMPAPSMEYPQYNMQGMGNALPQQGPNQVPMQGGNGYMGPPQQQVPFAPGGGPQAPMPSGHLPQQPQHQPGPNEAELIMFD